MWNWLAKLITRPGDWGNWPRPLDDAVSHQVEQAPPDRPGSGCGAERHDPPVHRPGRGK